MKLLLNTVISVLCLKLIVCDQGTYRAGVGKILSRERSSYEELLHLAAKSDVDILVILSPEMSYGSLPERSACELDNYDETIKTISEGAKRNGLYVVAHLHEKSRCQDNNELIRSNLVFDRHGAIISVYRKPLNSDAKCNNSVTNVDSFTTDFGVTFGVLMEEDIILKEVDKLSIKNFVLAGKADALKIPFLTGNQFSSPWAYITNVNLISSSGIFAGKSGLETATVGALTFADLKKDGEIEQPFVHPEVHRDKSHDLLVEDLYQYTVKPMNMKTSVGGYKETLCQKKICCEFYVKTSFRGKNEGKISYALAISDGVHQLSRNHNYAVQSCAVFACSELNKRTCSAGFINSTNVIFDEIIITGNFTKENSQQFPIILTTTDSIEGSRQFAIHKEVIGNNQKVTIVLKNYQNLLTFGILSRDYSRDFKINNFDAKKVNNNNEIDMDVYDYIYNEDFKEFFDYVWIRLRILFVVISIYVLEMM